MRKEAWQARLGPRLETLFCFFAVSVLMGAYLPIPLKLAGASLASGEADPLTTACRTAVLLVLALLCVLRWRSVAFVILQGKAVILFMGLAVASLAWSAAPDVTLRRVVTLSSTLIFAWYACASIPMQRMIQLLATSFLISGVASAVVAVCLPQIGVMTENDLAGAWSGVFMHKNALGAVMFLGCLSYGWLWVQMPERRFRYALCIVFCFVMAVMSKSRSSQVMTLLLPAIACAIGITKLGGVARLWAVYLLSIVGIAGIVLGTLFFADVTEALGKDPSLTGRVPLWIFLLKEIGEQPFLGFGYGAYFLDWSAREQWLQRLIEWNAPEAHEGYIELALQLGILGLVLGLWLLLSTVRLALSRPLRDEVPWASFAAVYAICELLANLDESMLMNPGDIQTLILPMLYVGLNTELALRRIAARDARIRDSTIDNRLLSR